MLALYKSYWAAMNKIGGLRRITLFSGGTYMGGRFSRRQLSIKGGLEKFLLILPAVRPLARLWYALCTIYRLWSTWPHTAHLQREKYAWDLDNCFENKISCEEKNVKTLEKGMFAYQTFRTHGRFVLSRFIPSYDHSYSLRFSFFLFLFTNKLCFPCWVCLKYGQFLMLNSNKIRVI